MVSSIVVANPRFFATTMSCVLNVNHLQPLGFILSDQNQFSGIIVRMMRNIRQT